MALVLQDCLTACDTHFGMGTVMSHQIFGPAAQDCLAAVRAELSRLEGLLSRFAPDSEISRINHSAGLRSERVCYETMTILARAAEISAACAGLLDVTIAPLVDLWNIRGASFTQPDAAAIQSALALVDWHDLILDENRGTAGLRRPGQSIDLGGIGKGYAADALMALFQEYGVDSALSNLGGNVVARGRKPDGSAWQVGIQHPRREGELIGALRVEDQAVVTSGDYRRYQTDARGRRFHHILDPRTGCPARSGLASVTVTADNAMDADAFATVLFLAGLERGVEMLRGQSGIEAIFVDEDVRVFVSAGLSGCFRSSANSVVIF